MKPKKEINVFTYGGSLCIAYLAVSAGIAIYRGYQIESNHNQAASKLEKSVTSLDVPKQNESHSHETNLHH